MTSLRTRRYSGILNPALLQRTHCTVIGVGGIGHHIAVLLAHLGIGTLTIYDPDTVNRINLGTQAYAPCHLRKPKVHACWEDCIRLNPQLKGDTVHRVFTRTDPMPGPVFLCVDKMSARSFIFSCWENLVRQSGEFVPLFDARAGAELLRILSITDEASALHYPTTLFADTEALRESCTTRFTPYCGTTAASILCAHLMKHLRSMPVDPDIMLNLLSMEIIRNDPSSTTESVEDVRSSDRLPA